MSPQPHDITSIARAPDDGTEMAKSTLPHRKPLAMAIAALASSAAVAREPLVPVSRGRLAQQPPSRTPPTRADGDPPTASRRSSRSAGCDRRRSTSSARGSRRTSSAISWAPKRSRASATARSRLALRRVPGPHARQRSVHLRARLGRALLERPAERRASALAGPHAQRDPARHLPDGDHRRARRCRRATRPRCLRRSAAATSTSGRAAFRTARSFNVEIGSGMNSDGRRRRLRRIRGGRRDGLGTRRRHARVPRPVLASGLQHLSRQRQRRRSILSTASTGDGNFHFLSRGRSRSTATSRSR